MPSQRRALGFSICVAFSAQAQSALLPQRPSLWQCALALMPPRRRSRSTHIGALQKQSRPVTLPVALPHWRNLTLREFKEIETELRKLSLHDYLAWTSTHPDAPKVERSAHAAQLVKKVQSCQDVWRHAKVDNADQWARRGLHGGIGCSPTSRDEGHGPGQGQ